MTYQEAETFVSEQHRHFHLNPDLTIAGKAAKYLGLIICPSDSNSTLKQQVYDETIKNGVNNNFLMTEMGYMGKDMNVFLIYLLDGREIAIPLEGYLQSLSKTS